jgi:hypothetical protein
MPVNFNSVPQGFAGVYAPPSPNANQWVGTEGLGTCLGLYVAVQGQGNFIGHMDCAVQVEGGPGDPDYNYVLETARDLIFAALGAYDPAIHTLVTAYSTSPDPSTKAMSNGVWLWGVEVAVTEAIGFRVRYNGNGLTTVSWNDTGTPIQGQVGFSVLPPMEPGPVIPD